MSPQDNPLHELADEDGNLLDEQGKLDVFRGSHTIIAPLTLQVEWLPPELNPVLGVQRVPCLVYPVPESWQPVVTNADFVQLLTRCQWGWEGGERFSLEALMARVRQGLDGSRGGATPRGLLNAFLRLTHEECLESELPDRVITQVETFVKKWGPLWVCRTLEHHGHGRRCYWDSRQAVYWGGTAALCSWRPVEEVYAFVREAREAKAVVQAAGNLRQGVPTDEAVCRRIGGHFGHQSGWDALYSVVRARLALHGQMTMNLLWLPGMEHPRLYLRSKLGFIHAVWAEIAQILCNAKGFYRCDACGKRYTREKRRPKAGQHQYCRDCRKGNRAASRTHMQRRRGRTL